ncbi:Riboflavin synthase alpha chain [Glycine soja]|uniref:Riboflavin synthase n=1 Tax=Glycine soja TaxID=3848 RepID=A0A0B2RC47_GLYSO|nr:Riboflavin synthase alpha chain [Glycine soja]
MTISPSLTLTPTTPRITATTHTSHTSHTSHPTYLKLNPISRPSPLRAFLPLTSRAPTRRCPSTPACLFTGIVEEMGTGHVDGTGEIVSKVPEGDSLWVKVKADKGLLKYIVPKGFIAVDGTSLTVVDVFDHEECFNFMLVAYTQQKVVIPLKNVGEKVNLETPGRSDRREANCKDSDSQVSMSLKMVRD